MKKDQWQQPRFLNPEQLQQSTQAPPQSARQFDPATVEQVDDPFAPAPAAKAVKKKAWKRWLAVAVTGLLGAVVGSELYRFIDWSFTLHPAVGIAAGALVVTVLGGLVIWSWHSLRGLRQLARTEALHEEALQLTQSRQHGNAQKLLKKLDQHYLNTPLNREFKDAVRQVDSAYNDSEIIRFVSDHAMTGQDTAARRIVRQYSVQSGMLVALSPYASFDMLLVGWRNLKMLREVAAVYGIAPGAATQCKLLGQVLNNIAFSGLSELMIDAGSQALGTSLTSQVSARVGQGVGAGLFTARTGIHAIRLCRPLPLSRDSQRALRQMKQQIIQEVSSGAESS